MPMSGKRVFLGRGKGYLNSAGAQYRFIIFLFVVLGIYTFLLKVFQKLAEIVQLPIFLPVALITLLFFIGIVGTLYSHKFIGPMVRIRKVIEHLAEGDTNVSLRLRESDDPALKELGTAITKLCEQSRDSHSLIQETAKDLFEAIAALQEKVRQGADTSEIQKLADDLRKKQELLGKAIASFRKAC